jgi:hypothetical protein
MMFRVVYSLYQRRKRDLGLSPKNLLLINGYSKLSRGILKRRYAILPYVIVSTLLIKDEVKKRLSRLLKRGCRRR